MNDKLKSIATGCFEASIGGSMSFPEIVATLLDAGFESYTVDFRRGRATYYLPNNESIDIPAPGLTGPIVAEFDKPAIQAAILEAQTNKPGYTFVGFCCTVRAAGCAGYMVSFLGQRAVYYGRTAEFHIEPFPARP